MKECHLPDFVRPYWRLIDFCLNNHTSHGWTTDFGPRNPNPENGQVYFLTIKENFEDSDHSRIHFVNQKLKKWELEKELDHEVENYLKRINHGKGRYGYTRIENSPRPNETTHCFKSSGGVFMASTGPGFMRVWDCSVDIDFPRGRDIEYLRWALPEASEEMR